MTQQMREESINAWPIPHRLGLKALSGLTIDAQYAQHLGTKLFNAVGKLVLWICNGFAIALLWLSIASAVDVQWFCSGSGVDFLCCLARFWYGFL